jgi:membrane-associated phospholipid phosphatase
MSGTKNSVLQITRRAALRTAGAGSLTAGAAFLGVAARPRPARAQQSTGRIEPRAGAWKPWLLSAGDQFRPAPPPDAAATRQELAELTALAARRDAATLDRIAYWDAGSVAYRWNEIFIEYSNITTQLGQALAGRASALMNVAIYDAIIATWDAKYAYNRPRPTEADPSLAAAVPIPRSPSYPSEHAAAAGAAAAVLADLFPRNATAFAAMAEEAARSRVAAGAQYPSDVAAGLELGRRVAALALERALTDGSDIPWTGSIPTGPGLWSGTNPPGVAEALWKPWLLASPDALRPPPPPAFDSPKMAEELVEVKNFARTPRTTALALAYNYGVYGMSGHHVVSIRQVGQRIFEEKLDANAPWAARAYATIAIAFMDAYIASQDAKFTYWTARPNQLDPSITTVFPTPNFPSYVSNRATFSAARATVLSYLFPREAATFQREANENAESAIWAGIHFRSDLEAGIAIGEGVARLLIERIRADG